MPNKPQKHGGCLLPMIVWIVIAAMATSIFYPKVIYRVEISAYPLAYEEIITRYAAENSLDPALVFAVVHTESRFQPDAVSHAGAKGLMQLTDDTNEWVAFLQREETMPEKIFEPELNVRRGCKLLAYLIEHFGNTETALAAYNAGIGRVNSWLTDSSISDDGITLQNIPFAETRAYVKAVTETRAIYQRLYFNCGV